MINATPSRLSSRQHSAGDPGAGPGTCPATLAAAAREARLARTVSTTVTINAAPADVWAVLCDLDRYPEWHPHIRQAAGQMQAGNRVVFDADTHTKVVQSEIYRGLVVPFIGKTIAATQIEFEEVNQALKRRVEQDPGTT